MSFILDALRKSDAERQRSAPPSLADVRYGGRRRRRDVWIPVLVVVLAINGLILGIRWLMPAAPSAPVAPAAAPATGLVDSALPAGPASGSSAGGLPHEVRPLAQEADALLDPDRDAAAMEPPMVAEVPETPASPTLAAAPPATTASQAGLASSAPTPTQAAGQAAAPISTEAPPPASSRILPADDLPTADALLASGRLGTTPLNLDLHVYSDSTASRFVVINSRKYKEGARLEEGPAVEAITPDGVILEHQGSRFILPRK